MAGKRKAVPAKDAAPAKKAKATNGSTWKENGPKGPGEEFAIQVVAGSYDRVLHGITATVKPEGTVDFADTFLFNAHTSAVRAVAVSPLSAPVPGQGQKVFLASGSTDERINLYNLSAHPPSRKNQELLSSVAPRPILENPKNRELGTLLHHSSSITQLCFPTRSKLLSSSEDSTIAITRTRDWNVLSTIKAPKPLAQGRPTGDTASFGGTPSGVNDFAVYPNMKLMISVSKGEKKLRLWNLMTGKKSSPLKFPSDLLREAGEGKYSTGEGRKIVWGPWDDTDEFAISFDRNVAVFGMDGVPKCCAMPETRTKIHDVCYIPIEGETKRSVLAVSTEDGRVVFFSTQTSDFNEVEKDKKFPTAKLVGQVGGRDDGISGRIKSIVVVQSEQDPAGVYVAGGSSDGKLRLWRIGKKELISSEGKKFGTLLGTYDTQNRITCMTGFAMIPRPEGVEDSEDEDFEESDEDSEDEDDE